MEDCTWHSDTESNPVEVMVKSFKKLCDDAPINENLKQPKL